MLLHLTIGVSLQLAEASSNNATVDCCRNVCIVSANVIRFFRFLFYYSMHFITVSFITAFGEIKECDGENDVLDKGNVK